MLSVQIITLLVSLRSTTSFSFSFSFFTLLNFFNSCSCVHTELCLFPIKLRLASWRAHTRPARSPRFAWQCVFLMIWQSLTCWSQEIRPTYRPNGWMDGCRGCVGSIHFWKVPILLIRTCKAGGFATYCHIGVQPFMSILKKSVHIQYSHI